MNINQQRRIWERVAGHCYSTVTRAAAVVMPVLIKARLRAGKETPHSLYDKRGLTAPVTPGRLWVHAVSVGEVNAVIPLLHELHEGGVPLLLTTGTLTGAETARSRLSNEVEHRFAPWDYPEAVAGFLRNCRPRAAVFVDSELWPNLLNGTAAAGIPLLLLNGRMSERSLKSRLRLRWLYAPLLRSFAAVLTPDEATARRFAALGATRTAVIGSLKAASVPPDAPEARAALLGRRAWAAVSLHPPEFAAVCAAQRKLRDAALCVAVPRHPETADRLLYEAHRAGLTTARRSSGESVTPATDLYLADTLGETGAWYRAAMPAFIGKSLHAEAAGGHNPYEAAAVGSAVLHGDHVHEFTSEYRELTELGAASRVSADDLAEAVREALQRPRMVIPPDPAPLRVALAAVRRLFYSNIQYVR